MTSLADLFLRFRILLFGIAAVLVVSILVFRPSRNENQTIEGMFAMDDELYSSYQRLKRTFGGNEVILIVYHDEQLMSEKGQKRQAAICRKLNKVDGIGGDAICVQSLITMIKSFDVDQFQSVLKFMGFDISTQKLVDNSKSLFAGFTHSSDEKTGAIVLLLKAKEDTNISRGEIVASIRMSIDEFRREAQFENEILMVGEPVMVADGFRMVQADGRRLGWVATIALSLVVLLAFRSIRWTLIPAAVVQFSLLTSEAIVAVMDIQVTIVGSMSTSIITVSAVSTTIHLIIRIRKNHREGMDYYTATDNAFRQLATPITFACLTDAVGFGALWFAELEPVQDFATVMFVGSLLVLVAFWSLVPTLALFRAFDSIPFWNLSAGKNRLHSAFSKGLNMPLRFSKRFPTLVVVATAGIFVFSMIGISRNTIESDFTKNFRSDSEIVKSYNFVEENLGGAGVWDVMVRSPEKLDTKFLGKIKRLQQRLRQEVVLDDVESGSSSADANEKNGLTKVLSLVDAIEAFSNKSVDKLSDTHLNVGMQLFGQRMPEFQKSLFAKDPNNEDESYYRIMLRSRERTTSDQKRNIINQVNEICSEEFPASAEVPAPTRTTGFYVLLTYMIDSVIRDQWTTFAAAAIGIIFMLFVSLRDLRLAVIGLMPNLLPIFFVLGGLGWIQEPINLGIALIAAVAIGLSIDSSIHYIYDFQQQKKGESVDKALELSQDQVGRALVYSTLALVIGFCSLCISDFLPTVYFGATAMIAMVGGLIGNLFLLPLFISMLFADNKTNDVRKNDQ